MRSALTAAQAGRLAEVLTSLRPALTLAECVRVESTTFLAWLRLKLGAGDAGAIRMIGAAEGSLAGVKPDALLEDARRMSRQTMPSWPACSSCRRTGLWRPTYEAWAEKLKANREKRPLSAVMTPAWGAAGRKLIAIDADLARVLNALRQMSDGTPKFRWAAVPGSEDG
ncbi:MAG: hypothetical protein U1G05_08265 [Kiritimatiellia bacterium]